MKLRNWCKKISIFMFCVAFLFMANAGEAYQGEVTNLRYSIDESKVRIVLDFKEASQLDYKIINTQIPLGLKIILKDTNLKISKEPKKLTSSFADKIEFPKETENQAAIFIPLKAPVVYKTLILENPKRLVIDMSPVVESKISYENKEHNFKYTSWAFKGSAGPVSAYIIELDKENIAKLTPALANNKIAGLETLSEIARRNNAVFAVNGSYFSSSGETIGHLKIAGQTINNIELERTALGIMDNQAIIGQFDYQATLEVNTKEKIKITALNRTRGENELILYNSLFGPSTKTNKYGEEVIINKGVVIGKNLSDTPIEPENLILSGHGEITKKLLKLKISEPIKFVETYSEPWGKAKHILGAGPMLVKDGQIYLTSTIEEFGSDVAQGRAPRSAVGIKKNGNLLIVVVDGRQGHSVGMTLVELALFMTELGADTAMNMDGGGSSTMVIDNKVVNSPSDGKERKIGTALLLKP